jgi:hypothetical protein
VQGVRHRPAVRDQAQGGPRGWVGRARKGGRKDCQQHAHGRGGSCSCNGSRHRGCTTDLMPARRMLPPTPSSSLLSQELREEDAARAAELAAYFTHCQMQVGAGRKESEAFFVCRFVGGCWTLPGPRPQPFNSSVCDPARPRPPSPLPSRSPSTSPSACAAPWPSSSSFATLRLQPPLRAACWSSTRGPRWAAGAAGARAPLRVCGGSERIGSRAHALCVGCEQRGGVAGGVAGARGV